MFLSMEGTLARALYSFQSDNPGELSVPEGGIIRVTQYIDNHWLEANYQGEIGLFPVTYAERLKNESHLDRDVFTIPSHDEEWREHVLSDKHGQSKEFSRRNDVLTKHGNPDGSLVESAFAFCARNDSELTFPSDALIEVTKDVDEDWLEGSFNGRTGLFPKSYIKSSEIPCARAVYPFVGESTGELTFREGDCIFLRRRLNSQWMEGEINGNVGLFPSSFVAVEVDLPPEKNAVENAFFSLFDSSSKSRDQSNVIAPKVKWKRGMKGKALFHFTALYSGDLELNKGDIVTVLDIDDDNWIEGQLDNGLCGSCPAAYLEPVYHISTQFENKPLPSRTQGFTSDDSFSAIFGDLVSDAGYINALHNGQQASNFLDSYSERENDSYKSFLDTSFTLDPTPALLPSNLPTSTCTSETVQRNIKPFLKPKPALGTKPTQNYSVKYLGGENSGELSGNKSHQATISPAVSTPSLPGGRVLVSYSKERTTYSSSETATSHKSSQFSFPSYQNSTGTWPGKQSGKHGGMAQENTNGNFNDEFDLLSGNCTSLPTPLLPLPQRGSDDRNGESSASEDSPITPRRPAPPPPIRNSSYCSKIQVRSSMLPVTKSKGQIGHGNLNGRVSLSIEKDQPQLDDKYIKQNGRPHNSSSMESTSDAAFSLKESSTLRAAVSTKPKPPSRPRSVYWKDMDSGDLREKVITV